ncbi:hypothetical protein J3459_010921 [Metarhizium acridum]|nr:hypothetical protein J3459_010921 [Metarhizium acridum]
MANLDEDDWLEERYAELIWWSSSLNPDKGPASLDSLLRLRPDVSDTVASALDGLEAALSEFLEIGTTFHRHISNEVVPDPYREQRFHIKFQIGIPLCLQATNKRGGLRFRHKRAGDDVEKAEAKYQRSPKYLGEYEALYGSDPRIGEHGRLRLFLTKIVLWTGYTNDLIQRLAHMIHISMDTIGVITPIHCYQKAPGVFRA